MANEDMKDVVRNQEFADPKTGKRKVVLGEEDYSDPVTPRTSQHKPESMIDLKTDPGYSGKSADTESGGFFRKFLNREPNPEDRVEGTRLNQSPVFDERKDAITADESTREVPMRLLGEDEEQETKASRLVREKDMAAMAEEITESGPVVLTDRERRMRRNKNRLIGGLIFALIGALLILFAPSLQAALFKTQDNSLIFSPASGLFGPRAGIIEIMLGLAGLGLVFSTLFTKRKEETLSRKQSNAVKPANPIRTAGLILLLLIPIGFASQFNFTEFRNDDIRHSSLFNQNKISTYSQVKEQKIFSEGEDIFYTISTENGPNATINITTQPLESVKLLDTKLPATRNVVVDSSVIQKMVEKQIYTEEEAIRLFITKK